MEKKEREKDIVLLGMGRILNRSGGRMLYAVCSWTVGNTSSPPFIKYFINININFWYSRLFASVCHPVSSYSLLMGALFNAPVTTRADTEPSLMLARWSLYIHTTQHFHTRIMVLCKRNKLFLKLDAEVNIVNLYEY